jgi:hypothetical protein
MELVLAAIAAGGLVGVSDQYLSLLILSIASRTGIFQLAEPMQFMSTYWFIGIVTLFWPLFCVIVYMAAWILLPEGPESQPLTESSSS